MVAAVDLFSGAGGFAQGFSDFGLSVSLSSDVWRPAAETYIANFPSHAFALCDARDLSAKDLKDAVGPADRPWILAGGPPCQGFSSAGARRHDDHRNTLVGVYATLAAEAEPDVVIFENVEGFLTAGGGRFVFDLLEPLIEADYRVALRKVNVANFGVPQLRKRVIAIAVRGREPFLPVPTHRTWGAPGVARIGQHLPPSPTVGEALKGLASPGAPDAPTLHGPPSLGSTDVARLAALGPGQTMRDLPEHLWHPSYAKRANRRVSDGMPTEKRGGAPAGLRRLREGEPSKAITSAASREFVHPTDDRFLTLRECARLQTFPDHFQFIGTRAAIATMIGNAVPARFAQALARVAMELSQAPFDPSLPGGLVRFEPTDAGGTSPQLARVIADVAQRFGRPDYLQGELAWG